jgi:hypothetical protein
MTRLMLLLESMELFEIRARAKMFHLSHSQMTAFSLEHDRMPDFVEVTHNGKGKLVSRTKTIL